MKVVFKVEFRYHSPKTGKWKIRESANSVLGWNLEEIAVHGYDVTLINKTRQIAKTMGLIGERSVPLVKEQTIIFF